MLHAITSFDLNFLICSDQVSGHYKRIKCRVGWRFLRSPPSVAQQHKTFFNECLTARLMGYGTNGVPNPSYIEFAIAWISAIRFGLPCCTHFTCRL